MRKNFMTAEEALNMSNESSVMDDIMMEIKKEALIGGKSISYQILNDNDIPLLQELGYMVREEYDKFKNHVYSISWDVSDN